MEESKLKVMGRLSTGWSFWVGRIPRALSHRRSKVGYVPRGSLLQVDQKVTNIVDQRR
jgi:hypothetical protein